MFISAIEINNSKPRELVYAWQYQLRRVTQAKHKHNNVLTAEKKSVLTNDYLLDVICYTLYITWLYVSLHPDQTVKYINVKSWKNWKTLTINRKERDKTKSACKRCIKNSKRYLVLFS